jgi:hypothetical protein
MPQRPLRWSFMLYGDSSARAAGPVDAKIGPKRESIMKQALAGGRLLLMLGLAILMTGCAAIKASRIQPPATAEREEKRESRTGTSRSGARSDGL